MKSENRFCKKSEMTQRTSRKRSGLEASGAEHRLQAHVKCLVVAKNRARTFRGSNRLMYATVNASPSATGTTARTRISRPAHGLSALQPGLCDYLHLPLLSYCEHASGGEET